MNKPASAMEPLERARKLRQEADRVMQLVGLPAILAPYGEMVFTGSYYLDVMAYPDLDLYIPKVSLEQIFQFGARLAGSELVTQVIFEKDDPDMPGGLYLKPRIRYGDWGRPWKIDIWSLEEAVIAEKMEPMHRFKQKLTDPLRERIIRYKLSVMTAARRTPMYSGYWIYKAFLDEGLTDFEQVNRYLMENGITLEQTHPA